MFVEPITGSQSWCVDTNPYMELDSSLKAGVLKTPAALCAEAELCLLHAEPASTVCRLRNSFIFSLSNDGNFSLSSSCSSNLHLTHINTAVDTKGHPRVERYITEHLVHTQHVFPCS